MKRKQILFGIFLLLCSASAFAQMWFLRAPFMDPRTGGVVGVEGAAVSYIGGALYVSHGFRGGDSVFLSSYNTVTDTWTHGGPGLPDAPGALQSELNAGIALGNHYAIGGRTGPSSETKRFIPGVGWATMAPMPTARGGFGMGSWAGLIYAIGGRVGGAPLSADALTANEVFDPVANGWSPLAPLPVAAGDLSATVAHNGRIYVFGGFDAAVTALSNTQIYDIASNTWSAGASMPTPRGSAMAGVLNCGGEIVIAVFGGLDAGFSNSSVTEFYTPATDSWSLGPSMPIASSEIGAGVAGDGLSRVFSVGSGAFGLNAPQVQELVCDPEIVVPTISPFGLALLVLLMAAGAGLFLARRREKA